jgi:hypothetical protein
MHKLGPVLGALSIFAVTVNGWAEPSMKVARPSITVAPTVRVVGFRRSAVSSPGALATVPSTEGQAPYTGGAYYLAVDVENTSASAADGIVVKLGAGGAALESTISIPAKATRTAIFTDTAGLLSSCAPKPYTINLAGAGTSTATRNAQVTPKCAFSSKVDEEWNHKAPDHVDAIQKNNVYLTDASLLAPPTCSAGPKMKVRIASQYPGSSPSLVVQAKAAVPNGAVKAQTAAAFPLGAKEYKELTLTPVAVASSDVAPKMALEIVDWTKSLAGHIADSGITVTTTRSCTLAFALTD